MDSGPYSQQSLGGTSAPPAPMLEFVIAHFVAQQKMPGAPRQQTLPQCQHGKGSFYKRKPSILKEKKNKNKRII